MSAEPISKPIETTEADFVPRAKYDALRETLELAIGVAISRAQIARGAYSTQEEVFRELDKEFA